MQTYTDINSGGKRLTFGPRSTTKKQSQGQQNIWVSSKAPFGFNTSTPFWKSNFMTCCDAVFPVQMYKSFNII